MYLAAHEGHADTLRLILESADIDEAVRGYPASFVCDSLSLLTERKSLPPHSGVWVAHQSLPIIENH